MGSVGTQVANTVSPNIVSTVQQAQQANNNRFKATDDADFHQLYNGRQYYQDQNFNIDTQLAIQDYLSDRPLTGSLYSPSQAINYKMETGQALSIAEQAIVDDMMAGMHNLGYNINLTRYGRVDYLNKFAQLAVSQGLAAQGINDRNFDKMTPAQLQKAFVGLEYSENKLVSTSYNNFATAPNGGRPFTDKAVKFNYKAPASAQGLMPGNGPGGRLGEIVLAPGQNYRITGVRFTGQRGRSGSSYYNQIEFDVEIY